MPKKLEYEREIHRRRAIETQWDLDGQGADELLLLVHGSDVSESQPHSPG